MEPKKVSTGQSSPSIQSQVEENNGYLRGREVTVQSSAKYREIQEISTGTLSSTPVNSKEAKSEGWLTWTIQGAAELGAWGVHKILGGGGQATWGEWANRIFGRKVEQADPHVQILMRLQDKIESFFEKPLLSSNRERIELVIKSLAQADLEGVKAFDRLIDRSMVELQSNIAKLKNGQPVTPNKEIANDIMTLSQFELYDAISFVSQELIPRVVPGGNVQIYTDVLMWPLNQGIDVDSGPQSRRQLKIDSAIQKKDQFSLESQALVNLHYFPYGVDAENYENYVWWKSHWEPSTLLAKEELYTPPPVINTKGEENSQPPQKRWAVVKGDCTIGIAIPGGSACEETIHLDLTPILDIKTLNYEQSKKVFAILLDYVNGGKNYKKDFDKALETVDFLDANQKTKLEEIAQEFSQQISRKVSEINVAAGHPLIFFPDMTWHHIGDSAGILIEYTKQLVGDLLTPKAEKILEEKLKDRQFSVKYRKFLYSALQSRQHNLLKKQRNEEITAKEPINVETQQALFSLLALIKEPDDKSLKLAIEEIALQTLYNPTFSNK